MTDVDQKRKRNEIVAMKYFKKEFKGCREIILKEDVCILCIICMCFKIEVN